MTPGLARVDTPARHAVPAPRPADVALAVAVAVAVAVEAANAATRGSAWANAALCVALAAPLAWWRAAPLAAAVGTFALATLQTALLTPLTGLVTPLVLSLLLAYGVARHATLRRALAGGVLCVAGGVLLALATPGGEIDVAALVATAALSVASWLAGREMRARTHRVAELAALDRRLTEARRARERLAIAEQRAHVARELHDLVAHAMTVICLQAGAAQRTWDSQPAHARRALALVGTTARETLAQLRDVLTLLDPGESVARLERGDLEGLAAGARAAGLDVAVDVVGTPRPLPAPVGLVAYRVVQEALTNAARHAAPTAVDVRLAYEADAVAVEVRDAGRRPGTTPPVAVTGSGHGLRGMRERVEACAGELSCGPQGAGGFAVRARLPLPA